MRNYALVLAAAASFAVAAPRLSVAMPGMAPAAMQKAVAAASGVEKTQYDPYYGLYGYYAPYGYYRYYRPYAYYSYAPAYSYYGYYGYSGCGWPRRCGYYAW